MAEPARLPEEDRPDIRPHDIPELRGLEGGGETSDPKRGHLNSVPNDGGGNKGSGKPSGNSRSPSSPSELKNNEENPAGGYYNPNGGRRRFFSRGRRDNSNHGLSSRQQKKILIGIGSAVVAGTVGLSTIFFMGIFNLPNFVKNIEQAGFQRYQVDMNGRSSKWLAAYMQLRFSEVEDFDHPDQAPQDRDNIYFRANRVDTNRPMFDWYRTLRASKFEQNLLDKGVKFTSYSYVENGVIKFRTGVIEFPGGKVEFDPKKLGYADLDAIEQGDVSKFNDKLSGTFTFTELPNDKAARAFIAETVKDNESNWWKATKRYHIRKGMNNMLGVRKWTFFENKKIKGKTAGEWREAKIAYRNKVIVQSLPDDSKSGEFIKCLFGIPDCKASTDSANPNRDDHSPSNNPPREGDKTDGNPDNPKPVGEGGEATVDEGLKAAGTAGDVAGKVLSKIVGKANALSLLDMLSRFDKAMNDGSASKIIEQIKEQKAIGYFTTFEVVASQITTGQQDASEVNAFMQQFKHPTNNEGWTTVVNPQHGNGSVSAASASADYVNAKDKAAFCSAKHQAEMKAHPEEAENEHQYLCPENRIGAIMRAQELEDSWNSSVGTVLHPFLDAFHNTLGPVFDVFNSMVGIVVDPIVDATLTTTGTKDNVEKVAAWGVGKAVEFGGANNLGVTDEGPSGQLAMADLQGSTAMAEAQMRGNGGATTTPESRKAANKGVMGYNAEQLRDSSLYERYLSPSNHKSLFATQFLAITTNFDNLGRNFPGVFASALSNPLRALTQPAHAAVPDGYAASKFAAIETFDMPPQCLDTPALKMTPQNSTNADDLGIFTPNELTWDLMNDEDAWYAALYDKVGGNEDKAKTVWNCALFDNVVRGSMSARYGYPGENALKSSDDELQGPADSATVSGDAQQLAQEILANGKISKTGRYVTEDLQHTANGRPAYGDVTLNLKLLQFMADLGKTTPFTITSITGDGCGHDDETCVSDGGSSNHYIGKAVDFGCGFDEAKADEIGKKYGIMADNERCDDGIDHSHFSEDGF